MNHAAAERPISAGEFRRLALEEAKRRIKQAHDIEESRAAGGFVKRVPPPLIKLMTLEELADEVHMLSLESGTKFPQIREQVERTAALAFAILDQDKTPELVTNYREILKLYGVSDDSAEPDAFSLRSMGETIFICAGHVPEQSDGVPEEALQSDIADQTFVASVSNMIALNRRKGRSLTQDEHSAVLAAYRLLDRGVQIPSAFRPIGVYGFRTHQTNLSVANPGDGHVNVTCASTQLLDGTVVHIEHIDRDGERDREKLEPYRLPATVNAARVRLHAGMAVPCTAYIGRPVFESGDVKRDLLKSVHMTASACSAMFANGIADCKIGIERMTATQAIDFMRAVAGNAVRDPTKQYLSAAFNINLGLIDDRDGTPIEVTDKGAVARLAIELAEAGRFEKVTWDGSSNLEPSVPIIDQLPFATFVELIHFAHERGLETYVSAGLQPPHMQTCTFIGVDGVGIGTSLHDYNPDSGLRGQLKAERIREVLNVRDAAAVTPFGRGAALLAQLDRMYFEGTLPSRLNNKRIRLFELMRDRQEEGVLALVEEIGKLPVAPVATGHPVLDQARRVVATSGDAPVGAARADDWKEFVVRVRGLLDKNDITQLYEIMP
ncbi:hypothetical protein [Bradyrhizobium sp. BRP23]|uniref:hypothetical protein n=1 Tax=Bradyrhizobium sp. BRP23 TaxID=2793820 RepID=UPI001CD32465|nr:hypothetical protein [Bradyrhizobium sp. BRP23]MCA1381454.1 hypothetical protein [Bradyrhizobium sp. BRP05]MCA1422290.1 hypothetical protein [Bradyrhizobium sp. BRP23]